MKPERNSMSHRFARCCRLLLGAALIAMLPVPGHPAMHALIMTISDYKAAGAIPLKGVVQDVGSAREMAHRLGVKDADMIFLKDQQLTLDGMRAAFDGLNERIGANDQVFIYFSGHGGRQMIADPVERCAESLITVDGYGFIDAELEANLKKLSKKAEKLIVFLDACHSGGVTTRSAKIPGRDSPFAAKYFSKSGTDACQTPVNVLKRSLGAATRSIGSGAQNYVYIAAARDNEVSLDEPGKGGVATQAWLECLGGAARDLDGSGAITAEEVRVCAQERIDKKLRNVPGFSTHHIAISGNSNAVLNLAQQNPLAKPEPPPHPAPVSTPPASPEPEQTASASLPVPILISPALPGLGQAASTVLPPLVLSSPISPGQEPALPAAQPVPLPAVSAENTLRDIYSGRDDRRSVTLATSRPAYKIGLDDVEFTLISSHPGFVYVLMVGSDGKTFDMLFPNQVDRNNQLGAGQTLRFPRPSWKITAGGPPGTNQLLVIVADAPRDFSTLKLTPAGPFSMLQANLTSAKDIQLVSGMSSDAASAECADTTARRNLSVAQRCSNAYGAAMVAIVETD